MPATTDVVDRPDEQRFVLTDEGHLAELTYVVGDGRLTLEHTRVPDALGGRGVGGTLVRAALARAAGEDLTIVPVCAFARRWLREHPDEASAAAIDWPPDEPGA